MDALSGETLSHFESEVSQLLVGVPQNRISLTVTPVRITATGLNGFVGMNADPYGEIYGRRLEAVVSILVSADTPAELETTSASVITALTTQERAILADTGILRVRFRPREPNTPGQAETIRHIVAEFSYEYLKLPEAAEGVIATIPIKVDLEEPK